MEHTLHSFSHVWDAVPGVARHCGPGPLLGANLLPMSLDSFLTRRWNNIISAALGIPLTAYVIWYFSTLSISEFAGFAVMASFGAAV